MFVVLNAVSNTIYWQQNECKNCGLYEENGDQLPTEYIIIVLVMNLQKQVASNIGNQPQRIKRKGSWEAAFCVQVSIVLAFK